jgi:hypothetical protein
MTDAGHNAVTVAGPDGSVLLIQNISLQQLKFDVNGIIFI